MVDDGCNSEGCDATQAEINYDTKRYYYKTCKDEGTCPDYAGVLKFLVSGLITNAISPLAFISTIKQSAEQYTENPPLAAGTVINKTSSAIPDDAFVHFDPSKNDASINSNGLLTSYSASDGKLWLTKYKFVKDITDPSELDTKLFSQSLWNTKSGYFDNGATMRAVNVDSATPAGVTNKVNGVPQWYITDDVPPSDLEILLELVP